MSGRLSTVQRTALWTHLSENILDIVNDSNDHKVLKANGYVERPEMIVTITDAELENLSHKIGNANKNLSKPLQGMIRILRSFCIWKVTQSEPIRQSELINVTADQVETFRATIYMQQYLANNPPPAAGSSTNVNSSAEKFKKGMKRDPSIYPTLKNDAGWDHWQRIVRAAAATQGCSLVFESHYTPISSDDVDVFKMMNEYIYLVFASTLLTDKGKSLVRDHDHDRDAQAIFKSLVEYYTASMKSKLETSTLLEYVTTERLGPGTSWNGPTHGFILHFQEQIRRYHALIPKSDHLSEAIQRTMLSNAVRPIPELAQVNIQASQLEAQGSAALSFNNYVKLLLTAAIQFDSTKVNTSGRAARRRVYMHEWGEDEPWGVPTPDIQANFHGINSTDYGEYQYDIDSPVQTIMANAANTTVGGSRLPDDSWSRMSNDDRRAWMQLSPTARSAILGVTPTNNPINQTTPGGSNRSGTQRPPSRRVNLHDVTLADYIAMRHAIGDIEQQGFQVNEHETTASQDTVQASNVSPSTTPNTNTLPYPGDLRAMMSSSGSRNNTRNVNAHFTYNVASTVIGTDDALVDRGANGGMAGDDVRVIAFHPHRQVDVQGIDKHRVNNLKVATVGAVVHTNLGPRLAIWHQMAYTGRGSSILSSGQMEHYGIKVDDRSVKVGGQQSLQLPGNLLIPLDIIDGLPRLPMRPYTDKEFIDLPQIILSSDEDWDPRVLDHNLSDDQEWFNAQSVPVYPTNPNFDETGNFLHRSNLHFFDAMEELSENEDSSVTSFVDRITQMVNRQQHAIHDSTIHGIPTEIDFDDQSVDLTPDKKINDPHHWPWGEWDPQDEFTPPVIFNEKPTHPETSELTSPIGTQGTRPIKHSASPRDYDKLRPLFAWQPTSTIKRTFELTTQYARMPHSEILKVHYRSPHPAANIHRRNEDIATDTIFSDVPALDGGATCAQLFVGTTTMTTDVYPMRSEKEFVNTLEDVIRYRGAPTRLISDNAQSETSNRVKDILRTLVIGNWTSEPRRQHQNPAERRIQTIKTTTNIVLDRSGAPASTWLLALLYVCFVLNHCYSSTINGIPLTRLTGTTVDISPLLRFHFWQEVYYKEDENSFPSESPEKKGYIVGIAEHCGHLMTYKVLTQDTKKVIFRSDLRPVHLPNKRLDIIRGEELQPIDEPVLKTRHDYPDQPESEMDSNDNKPPVFNPEELIGRSFLIDNDDGTRNRATITEVIADHEAKLERHTDRLKFKISIGNDQFEELLTYQQMLDHITKDEESNIVWKFKRIVRHQGPLVKSDPLYNGSTWNVEIEWENGEITVEPLSVIAADDPVTCAIYAKENDLLELPGWKRFKSIASRQKKYLRMVKQAKLRSYRTAPKYMFGYEVPRNYKHAVELDKKNGNTKWQDCTELEMQQLREYEVFRSLGKSATKPTGYKQIRVHLVYAVKHDGRHKARLVADGHLTDIPHESVYSGVVSLKAFKIVVFLAELNGLLLWTTDIGNAYLEAKTKEKLIIIAGPEFKELEGHTLVIEKALYGLRTSGLRWHERFAQCLRDLGFFPCRAEPDVWIRDCDDHYEYVAVYVDDLAIAMKQPQPFVNQLVERFKFKLKGTGPIEYHLGMDFFRDPDGTLAFAPRKYIEKMVESYHRMFGEKPKQNVYSPLEPGDHPELDTTEFLNQDQVSLYQSLIGMLQWVVTIGRFDVQTAVMTLSSFRAAPRQGHMGRAKRIFGYLAKFKHAAVRIRTGIPDYSRLPENVYDWELSVYGTVTELLPHDAPPPKGRPILLTSYVDANLMHDILTGRSVTGILHFINQTPFDHYSKKQATVETATYGSEFVAARTCVEQIIDNRNTLRYFGIPVNTKTYMFGDNKSVVDSATIPHAKLNKRHTMLSFHRVREAIASKIIAFFHIPGDSNPADILSKHWSYSKIWKEQLQPALFYSGDTADLMKDQNDQKDDTFG